MMNCKQGDLAYVLRGTCAGKIVQCVRWIGEMRLETVKGLQTAQDVWYIEPTLIAFNGAPSNYARDSGLRPIRDPGDDAHDETLDWLPVPQEPFNLVISDVRITK